jgi:hypothetical protein
LLDWLLHGRSRGRLRPKGGLLREKDKVELLEFWRCRILSLEKFQQEEREGQQGYQL